MINIYIVIGILSGLIDGYFFPHLFGFTFNYTANLLHKISSSHTLIVILSCWMGSLIAGIFLILPIVFARFYFILSIDSFKLGFMAGIFIGVVIYKSTRRDSRNRN